MAVLAFIGFFALMEFMAWFAHKYIMHGPGWVFHRDHHQHEPGFFERNDVFFLLFAIPSCLLIIFGSIHQFDWRFFAGFGIAAYGLCYFLVHDVFIHQRFSWFKRTDNVYFRAIRKAHKVHHKHLQPENGECFGMLVVPWKYIREAMKDQNRKRN